MSLEKAILTLAEAILESNALTRQLLQSEQPSRVHAPEQTAPPAEQTEAIIPPVEQSTEPAPRKRRTKAEIAAAAQAAVEAAEQAAEAKPVPAEANDSQIDLFDGIPETNLFYTIDDVREEALKLRDRVDTTAVKLVLAHFEVEKLTDLAETQYGAFVNKCRLT